MERYTLQQRIEVVKIHYKMVKIFLKQFVKLKVFSYVMKHLLGQLLWSWCKNSSCWEKNTSEYCFRSSLGLIFFKMKLERLFRGVGCAIEPWLMNFYGKNWKIWMWTMFISNKKALLATQVAIGHRVHAINHLYTFFGGLRQKQDLCWCSSVNSRTQREDSCRYRRNRAPNVRKCNVKFHLLLNTITIKLLNMRFSYKSKWNL